MSHLRADTSRKRNMPKRLTSISFWLALLSINSSILYRTSNAFTITPNRNVFLSIQEEHLLARFRHSTVSHSTKISDLEPAVPQSTPTPNSDNNDDELSALDRELELLPLEQIKSRLLDLLTRMTGKSEEHEELTSLINAIEAKYEPVLTIDFFNMAVSGDWQLLFSTNMLNSMSANLRLSEMIQRIEPNGMSGNVTNIAQWDQRSDGVNFDISGTMNVHNTYTVGEQGAARMQMTLKNHAMQLNKGSKKPDMNNLPTLVGMIQNAMPSELFDPNGLGLDTTFLDGNLRIVRITANLNENSENTDIETVNEALKKQKYDGVRNIFIRKGSVKLRPV